MGYTDERFLVDVLYELGDSGGYDWSVVEVGRRQHDGQLMIRGGTGCSCSSIDEETWVVMTELRLLDEYINSFREDWNGDPTLVMRFKMDVIGEVRKLSREQRLLGQRIVEDFTGDTDTLITLLVDTIPDEEGSDTDG